MASLHPQTVSEYQKHTTKKATPKRARNTVKKLQIDQRVWTTAMKLAGGDRSRIVVHSETEVVVVNPSQRKV